MPGRRKIERQRVLDLLAKGCTQQQVALRLGYPKSAVSQIANGKYGKEPA
jgi:transcriptional regulator with XRE-family HTH domain